MIVIERSPLYKCEVCGQIYENKKMAEECEKKEKPILLVNIGDIIYFKDCEKTPVLFGEEKKLPCYSYLFDDNCIGREMRKARSICLDVLYKYEVSGIKIYGHNVEYILRGIKGESTCFNASIDFEHFWHYPSIFGNDLMRKVLKEYNSQ